MSGRLRWWVIRLALAVVLLQTLAVGLWAGFAPHSFFRDFPGAGLRWIDPADSYDEHLVRDVGTLNLALAIGAAASLSGRLAPRLMGWMWLTMALPHAAYHVSSAGGLTAENATSSLCALSVSLGAGVALALLGGPVGSRPDADPRQSSR